MIDILAVYSYAILICSRRITSCLFVQVYMGTCIIFCTLGYILLTKPNPWCKYRGTEMTNVVQPLRIILSLGSN